MLNSPWLGWEVRMFGILCHSEMVVTLHRFIACSSQKMSLQKGKVAVMKGIPHISMSGSCPLWPHSSIPPKAALVWRAHGSSSRAKITAQAPSGCWLPQPQLRLLHCMTTFQRIAQETQRRLWFLTLPVNMLLIIEMTLRIWGYFHGGLTTPSSSHTPMCLLRDVKVKSLKKSELVHPEYHRKAFLL